MRIRGSTRVIIPRGTLATSLYAIDVELDLVVSGNTCRRCCYTSPRITFTTTSHSTSGQQGAAHTTYMWVPVLWRNGRVAIPSGRARQSSSVFEPRSFQVHHLGESCMRDSAAHSVVGAQSSSFDSS